jgi:hypothetical protein
VNGPAGRRPPTWLPWALCWISLALLAVGLALRIAYPETFEDEVFYAAANALGLALVPPVGALIATRLPTNPYGWLWCALGFLYAVVAASDGLRRTSVIPGGVGWVFLGSGFTMIVCLLVFVLLLFPTGRLPGPAWRWPARAAVLDAAAMILVIPFAPSLDDTTGPGPWVVGGRTGDVLADILSGGFAVMLFLILTAAASVLLRFRRAGPVERQQLKWFVLAAGLASVSVGIDLLGIPVDPRWWAVVDAIGFALFPVAVGIAVLRYRLYEIDRIISRTLSYGLLTGGLIALYFGLIAVLRPLLEPVTGSSALAVAGSTLAVAAVFNPARRRLQAVVDRRFDRAGYDAARVVDAFAARLRDQVDLDEVTDGLRNTVAATVAPTRVAVWLRVPRAPAGAGP